MLLIDLLKDIAKVKPTNNCEIIDLSNDSRKTNSGYLFVAYPGVHVDGRSYVKDAVVNGASAVLVEAEGVSAYEHNWQQNNLDECFY